MDTYETTASAVIWAHHEFGEADFGDKRPPKRLCWLVLARSTGGRKRTARKSRMSMQLHSTERVRIWATMVAAVSTRIERLKQLARTQSNLPATIAFTSIEIDAIVMLKRKKKTETIPDGVPTIEQAVRYVADIGGYNGKSSGGPAGAVTILRGLERIAIAVEVLTVMENHGRRCD